MRHNTSLLFCLVGLLCNSILYSEDYSDLADDPVSQTELDSNMLPPYFRSLEADYNWISKSTFTTPEEKGRKIGFTEGDVTLSLVRLYSVGNGFSLGVGYEQTRIDWKNNEFFNNGNYNRLTLSGFRFTKCTDQWDVRLGFIGRFDTYHIDFSYHTTWDFLFWGRYSWNSWFCDDVGLHFGTIWKTGIDKSWALPIVGIDFAYSSCLKINLVFPVDLSLVYQINKSWYFVATNRFWNTRQRLRADEPLSEGIFEYRNAGIDFGLRYESGYFAAGQLHIGSTYRDGDIKISNKNDHTIRHNKFKGAFYFGGEIDLKF
ncbi:MAG: hypothetical protein Tsb0021_00010 [Chlamydiales bacterium]